MKRILFVIAILIATASAQDRPKQAAAIRTDLSPAAPRYQLFVNPNVRADTFMLDTQTGKVWRLTEFTDLLGDPDVWIPVDRVDDTQELGVWLQIHVSKAKAKADGIGQ